MATMPRLQVSDLASGAEPHHMGGTMLSRAQFPSCVAASTWWQVCHGLVNSVSGAEAMFPLGVSWWIFVALSGCLVA